MNTIQSLITLKQKLSFHSQKEVMPKNCVQLFKPNMLWLMYVTFLNV